MVRRLVLTLLCAGAISGCGGSGSSSSETTIEEGASSEGGESGSSEGGVVIEDDDNRVSTSAGEAGGVVVLWPRVMGLPENEANDLQEHMATLVRRVFPNRPVDVRPDPERVCPRGGCRGISLGALLVTQNGACSVVAVIGRPGEGELTLIPWAG